MSRKVLVLGAGGIIGQHMKAEEPESIEAYYPVRAEVNLEHVCNVRTLLACAEPDVVVNLAGESRPDVVENDPAEFFRINIGLPCQLAEWAIDNCKYYVHVSTQAVFGGDNPDYSPLDFLQSSPVNSYGLQKSMADTFVHRIANGYAQIVRPSFILGVRKESTGRPNPLEAMLSDELQYQVSDRWFSRCWADDAAQALCQSGSRPDPASVSHVSSGERLPSRYDIARVVNPKAKCIVGVPQEYYKDATPRPVDTTYSKRTGLTLAEGLRQYIQGRV